MPQKYAFVMIGQSNGNLLSPYLQTAITAFYGVDSLLIEAAVDGSTIESWQPGQTNYLAAKEKIEDAIDDSYTIKAIIMAHGETNAWDTNPITYGNLAVTAIDGLRAVGGNPYMNVFYVQLGKFPSAHPGPNAYPSWDTVRMQQLLMMWNRQAYVMVNKFSYDVYDNAPPYAHDTAAAQQNISNLIMKYVKALIPAGA